MARVSLIIPVYNVEKYLAESLDSALGQSCRDIEIICVNDGSTDGSSAILDGYASRDSRIRVLNQPNRGLSAARNAGFAVATGDYVLFLDSDDLLEDVAVEHLVAKASEESLDVLFYDADSFADEPVAEKQAARFNRYYGRSRAYTEPKPGAELIAELMAHGDYLCSACFEIWRTGFLRDHGFRFTEGVLHEDTEFTFRAALGARRAAHLNEVLFHRRVRASGSIMSGVTSFASSYGAFRAFLGMSEAYGALGRDVVGGEWLLKEMDAVLSVSRDRYELLNFGEKARQGDIANLRFRQLYRALIVDPVEGRKRSAPPCRGEAPTSSMPTDPSIKVSVIIPVYNMGKYVGECLDSVLGQTLREIEVICVDDGSTDGSPRILAGYACQDSRVKVITQKNLGVFAARNNALDAARGEYVIFMDPDDWYCDLDALRTLYAEARANKVRICGAELVEMLDKNQARPLPAGYVPSYRYRRGGFIEFTDYQYFGWYTRFLFERALLEENGIRFPPYTRYQDPPFLVRAMLAAGRFYALKRPFYAVRVEHKEINWQTNGCRKLVDFMAGNADIFQMARERGLERLFNRQRENLVSTGMLQEVLRNLSVSAVKSGFVDMLRTMGYEACCDLMKDLFNRLAMGVVRSNGPCSRLRGGKPVAANSIRGIWARTVQCYHDEGLIYTAKRLLCLGRK